MAQICEFASEAAAKLREMASVLDHCPAPQKLGPWQIPFDSIEAVGSEMLSEVEERLIGTDRCIYTFMLTEETAAVRALDTLKALKLSKPQTFAAPKINVTDTPSQCLYVGSSYATGTRRQTLKSRLKQHLGMSNSTTFAMHLARWATGLPGSFDVTIWQYPEEVDRQTILTIEDLLSETNQPILGKRGSAR